MDSDDKKERKSQTAFSKAVRDYVSPAFIGMSLAVPEKGFATSGADAGSPSKWEVGNEDWWND